MPIKIKKMYADIPQMSNYLISNYGEVIKKSTWKKITVINNTVILTINSKRTKLTISKLLREIFTLQNLPICYKENKVITVPAIKKQKSAEKIKHSTTVSVYNADTNTITAQEEIYISKYGRTETFLQFVNRLRDKYEESKLYSVEEAAEWYEIIKKTYVSLPQDHIY